MSPQTRPSTLVRGRSGRLLGLAVVSAVLSTLVARRRSCRPGPTRPSPRGPAASPSAAPAGATAGACPSTGPTARRRTAWTGSRSWRSTIRAPRGPDLPARSMIKVWVTSDTDGSLRVLPSPGLNVRDGVGGRFTVPTGSEVQVLADQSGRLRLPAELPHRRRPRRHRADRSVQGHLVVLQPQQVRPGGAAQRVGADLPRLDGADQVGEQRADHQPGAGGGLRPRGRSGGDADLLAGRRGARPGRGRPLVRGPAPGEPPLPELRPVRHHGVPGLPRHGRRDHRRGRRRPGDRRHDPDLPRDCRPHPVRLLQRRAQRPGRLSRTCGPSPTRTTGRSGRRPGPARSRPPTSSGAGRRSAPSAGCG